MKRFAAFLLMLISSYAQADCQDVWLEYLSPKLRLSVVYSEGCYSGELKLSFEKFSKKGPRWSDVIFQTSGIPFNRECQPKKKNKHGETVEFTCRKDGVSPLAGASYRLKVFKTTMECDGAVVPDSEYAFICTSGCKPATPKRLHVPFGEGCS